MKNFRLLSMLMSVAVVVSLIMVGACTKEGPQGPAGADGKDGEDGIDGKDGNATCGVCHDNSELVETKILQWGVSTHAVGGNFERNAADCGACHTSQGFKERIANGTMEADGDVMNPSNINCYTCHMIHDTYSVDDWALRSSDPVALWIDPSITLDYGNANLCVQCHQPRVATIPDVNNPDGDYEITSIRFGPHHGPQSTVLSGNAFYMVGSGYTNSMHADIADGCITCHMADPYGSQAGGHTFSMDYEYHGSAAVWAAGCIECHGSEDDTHEAIEEWEAEFEVLAQELQTLLLAEGVLDEDGYAVEGTYSNKVAGALWNYRTIVLEDRSKGIHNPKFVEKILENSIASLQE
jgi:hypothetical protein